VRWIMVVFILAVSILSTACQHEDTHSQPPQPALQDPIIQLPGNAYPISITHANDGAIWVCEHGIGAVARIDSTGHVTQHLVTDTSRNPDDILQGPDGDMWFRTSTLIGRMDLGGQREGWAEGSDRKQLFPDSITVGPDGAIWFTNIGGPNATIGRVARGQSPSTVAKVPGDMSLSFGRITTGPDHAAWFSEVNQGTGPDAIGRVNLKGTYTSWQLPNGTIPGDIVTGSDGALWFTELSGIGRITTDGTITQFPVSVPPRPGDIVAGPDGALWFTTPTQVGRITTTGQLTMLPVPDAKALASITVTNGGEFWLTDTGTDVVRRFTPPH